MTPGFTLPRGHSGPGQTFAFPLLNPTSLRRIQPSGSPPFSSNCCRGALSHGDALHHLHRPLFLAPSRVTRRRITGRDPYSEAQVHKTVRVHPLVLRPASAGACFRVAGWT